MADQKKQADAQQQAGQPANPRAALAGTHSDPPAREGRDGSRQAGGLESAGGMRFADFSGHHGGGGMSGSRLNLSVDLASLLADAEATEWGASIKAALAQAFADWQAGMMARMSKPE